MAAQCLGIAWLGVKTHKFEQMKSFYRDILRLPLESEENGFAAFQTENGDTFELFDAALNEYPHFSSSPVAGFLVENIVEAKKDLEYAGIEFIGGIEGSVNRTQWAHFRGPDGNIYELKWKASK